MIAHSSCGSIFFAGRSKAHLLYAITSKTIKKDGDLFSSLQREISYQASKRSLRSSVIWSQMRPMKNVRTPEIITVEASTGNPR